jgi:hypothetical protein
MSQAADLTQYSPQRSPSLRTAAAGGDTDCHAWPRAYNSITVPSAVSGPQSGWESVAVGDSPPLSETAERVEIMDRSSTPPSSRNGGLPERACHLQPGRRWRWRFFRGSSSSSQTENRSCATAVMRSSLSYQLDQLSSCQVK